MVNSLPAVRYLTSPLSEGLALASGERRGMCELLC